MVIESESTAHDKLSRALTLLGIAHTERRLGANRVEVIADVGEDDAKSLVHLALEATFR